MPASSERLDSGQRSLLDEAIDGGLATMEIELESLRTANAMTPTNPATQPKRAALPADLPRPEIRHQPEVTTCACGGAIKGIGEDVAEKLDYVPGVFTVERHVRGKWACVGCQTLIQAPVPAQVINKGIPTAGLLAQVLARAACGLDPLCAGSQGRAPGTAPGRLCRHPVA